MYTILLFKCILSYVEENNKVAILITKKKFLIYKWVWSSNFQQYVWLAYSPCLECTLLKPD